MQPRGNGTLIKQPAEPLQSEMFVLKLLHLPDRGNVPVALGFRANSVFCKVGQEREENEFELWAQLYK